MRNLFHKILSALNFKGRDWVVLLLALLLAFSIWLIHNLSLNYNDYFSVSVVAECSIPGHAEESSDRCEVTARCRATGYKLLRAFFADDASHKVRFRASDMTRYDEDVFYITSSHLQEYSHLIFGPGVSVEYFLSDTLFFRFPVENCKKVPVTPISVIKYKEQYMADGPLTVVPDSVLVYGEPYLLEGIDQVYTRAINYSDVSEDLQGIVELEKIKRVRFSVDEVQYNADVKRYVEMTLTLPVKPVNVPHDKLMRVYPFEAKVNVRCAFPLTEDPEKGLVLVADYNDFADSKSGKIPLSLSSLSRDIIAYEIEPMAVSVLIENQRP